MKNKVDKSTVLVGSDFEMFVENKDTGDIVSAIPYLIGTKQNPEKTDKDGCCTQHDGILAECNVPPVKMSEGDLFIENVNYVKEYIKDNYIKDKNLRLTCCASAVVPDEQLLDPEANQIGCDSDYNAWKDGEINDKPDKFPGGLRTTGGHFHFSYPDASVDRSIELMKVFDTFVAVPLVLIDRDTKRRELYGQAGAFRLQNWGEAQGFEARTLSGYCFNSEDTLNYIFGQINQMFDYYNANSMKEIDKDADKIIECINTSNQELALELCKKYEINILLKPTEEALQRRATVYEY